MSLSKMNRHVANAGQGAKNFIDSYEHSDYDYFKALYTTERPKTPSEMFSDWLYKTQNIGNGHQLIACLEDTTLQEQFLRDNNLPLDTEL